MVVGRGGMRLTASVSIKSPSRNTFPLIVCFCVAGSFGIGVGATSAPVCGPLTSLGTPSVSVP